MRRRRQIYRSSIERQVETGADTLCRVLQALVSIALFSVLLGRAELALAVCIADPEAPIPSPIGSVQYLRSYYGFYHSPTRLAVDPDGNIYVTDPVTGRVHGRAPDGSTILDLEGLGYPVGIAAGNGVLYIGDNESGKVKVYTPDGLAVGHLGQGDGEFGTPLDIAVDHVSGDVYVADSQRDLIRRFDSSGAWKGDIGGSGSADGLFDFPASLDIRNGEIFVSDQRNSRIQVLDLDGNFKFCIDGQVMSCSGWFCQCGGSFLCASTRQFDQGIHVDTDQRIYIADGFEGSIYAMARSGLVTDVIGDFSVLRMPTDIIVDDFGRMFVATANRGRLDIYGLGQFQDPERFVGARLEARAGIIDRETAGNLLAYLEVPGYRLADIDPTSIVANDAFYPVTLEIGDHDGDTQPDLRLEFGQDLVLALPAGESRLVVSALLAGPAQGMQIRAAAHVTVSGDLDSDGDGVVDSADHCPATLTGDAVNPDGCSLAQLCPCAGPDEGGDWKNHGQYVKCVTHTVKSFIDLGIFARKDKDALVSIAAQSLCGG